MNLKYLLVCCLLVTTSIFVNANDEPCFNPQESGILSIPSVSLTPHTIEISVFGNYTKANGSCELMTFNVQAKAPGNNNLQNTWLLNETGDAIQCGSTTLFNTNISWASEMHPEGLIVKFTATNDDGTVADQRILILESTENANVACCDLPPYGCAQTTEAICDRMGGIFWEYGVCSSGDGNRRPSCEDPLYPSGSGEERDKKSNVEEKAVDLAEQLSVDFNYDASYKSIQLKVQVPKTNLLNVQIYNLVGQPIYQQSHYALEGRYSKTIQLPNDISSGIYFINIRSGNQQITKKIIIAQ